MRDINWQSRKEIADEILSLRNAMNFSAAIDVCLEATKRYPNNYFYPKIAGDLCYELHDYEAASHLYIEFLKHIPNIEKFFADFANRYDRLKRVWSKDRISEYASAIMLEIKRGCIENQVKQYAENLIKTDLPASITLSQQGNEFLSLLNNDNKFNALVTLERYLERNQSIELISILDKVVLNRHRKLNTYRIDTHCISIYEKHGELKGALKVAEELLDVKFDAVTVRSIFRICRKIGNYEQADRLLKRYPEILKDNNFNILYELVYYYESKDDPEALQAVLQKMERNSIQSVPILRTARNFYLRFGLLEDARRVDVAVKDLIAKAEQKSPSSVPSAVQETDEALISKIDELYSQVEYKSRLTAISDLTTGISHELGQPITNIRYTVQFYSRIFEKGITKEDVLKVFASILEETERMGALVKRLSPLTSSKGIAEKFDLLERIHKRVQSENARLWKERIIVNIAPKGPIYLFEDPVKFDQVISNLLLNAIDAIRERKGRTPNRIQIKVEEDPHDINILFEDNGVGISVKNRGKVFDPFFTTKPPGKGEGLGLFIVWNILKMFGGKIVIDPRFHEGTRFLITVPKTEKEEDIEHE